MMNHIIKTSILVLSFNIIPATAQETDRATELRTRAEAAYAEALAFAMADYAMEISGAVNEESIAISHLHLQGEIESLKSSLEHIGDGLAEAEESAMIDARFNSVMAETDVVMERAQEALAESREVQARMRELLDMPEEPPAPITIEDLMTEGYEPPPVEELDPVLVMDLEGNALDYVEHIVLEIEDWVEARRAGRDPYQERLDAVWERIIAPTLSDPSSF